VSKPPQISNPQKTKRSEEEVPPSKKSKVSTEPRAPFQPDSFFVEEVGDAPPEEDGGQADGRSAWQRKSNSLGPRGRVSGKPPTKQEARLMKWQSERKQKTQSFLGGPAHFPSARPAGSQAGSQQAANQRTGEQRSFISKRPATAPPQRSTGSAPMGGERRPFARQGAPPNIRSRPPSHQPAEERKKAAWEQGGGVSAAAVTAITHKKLSGGIITVAVGAKKKIVFDD
jgi:hypothetical protein